MMSFMKLIRNEIHRYQDGLVLLCVIQAASSSIFGGKYGNFGSADPVWQWYGLAALYGCASWLASAGAHQYRSTLISPLILLVGACMCGYYAQSLKTGSSSSFTVTWQHWMGLSLCFSGRAYSQVFSSR